MERVKLNSHHIEFLAHRYVVSKDRPDIKAASTELISFLFGPGHVRAIEEFEEQMTLDTLVEVVKGNDYVCEKLSCPYYDLCRQGNYHAVYKSMEKIAPVFLLSFPHIMQLHHLSPSKRRKEERAIRKKYNLKVKRAYSFADIVGRCEDWINEA